MGLALQWRDCGRGLAAGQFHNETREVEVTRARLLLVEDNPAIQAELREALAGMFEQAAVIATAQEAVAWLQAHPEGWDLAVVDIFLRQGHGFEVLRACSARQPHQEVVVLSNYTREPARSSALAQGADVVFDKSFEMEQFLAYCTARAHAHAGTALQEESAA